MRKIILSVLLLSVTAMAGAQTITIAKQGHFSVGGQTIRRPGHTITVNSSAGRSRKKPVKAIVPTMPSWIFKYRPIARNFLSYMCMVTGELACAGR